QWRPLASTGFDPERADRLVGFFKALRQELGSRYLVWMDTYFPTDVNRHAYSMPEEAYDYVDIVEMSSFYQAPNGYPTGPGWLLTEETLCDDRYSAPCKGAGPLAARPYRMLDTLDADVALKRSHPNLRVIWTLYYADPWYVAEGAGETTAL